MATPTFPKLTQFKISIHAVISANAVYLIIKPGEIKFGPIPTVLIPTPSPFTFDFATAVSDDIAALHRDHGTPHVQLKVKLENEAKDAIDEWTVTHDFLKHAKVSKLPLNNVADPKEGTLTIESASGWIEPQIFNIHTRLFPSESDKLEITSANITKDFATPLPAALDVDTVLSEYTWDVRTSDPVKLIDHGVAEAVENITGDTILHPRTRVVYINDPVCEPCSKCPKHRSCKHYKGPKISYTKAPCIKITLPNRKQFDTESHVKILGIDTPVGDTDADYSVLFRNLSNCPAQVFAPDGTIKLITLPVAQKVSGKLVKYTEVKVSHVNGDKYSVIRSNTGEHTV